MEEKEYEIWLGGYSIQGGGGKAQFINKSKGVNFADACKKCVYPDDYHYEPLRGKPLKIDYEGKKNTKMMYGKPTDWGISYFDNEVDARKQFG